MNVFSGLTSLTQLSLHNNRLTDVPAKVFSGLSALKYLFLNNNRLTDLPAEVFSELPALIQLLIHNNELPALPTKVFSGITAPTLLWLHGNTVNPLPLTVSLDKVGTSQFKATVDAGAPFTIVLSLTVENGSISSGATTLTIPAGDVVSQSLTVTRTAGTTAAVTVDIGTLPGLPSGHKGYQLAKSTDLPLTIIGAPDNNAPLFTEGASTTRKIAENTAAGVNIGNPVAATDADNDTLTYKLAGTDASSFSINSTTGQLKTKAALDYETKNTYTVKVTVSDGSLTDTITVTINVTDVNELPDTPKEDTPEPTTDTRTAFESNTPAEYKRVTLSDNGRVYGIPTKFTTDSHIGTVAFMALGKLMECSFADAEVDRQSIVYIKTQTLGRLSNFESETVCGKTSSTWTASWLAARITHLRFFDESSTPNVREAIYNVATGQIELPETLQQPPTDTTNTAPVFTDGTSTTRKIAENTAAGQNIGTAISATDADSDTLTYTLGGTDAAAFSIVSTTGQLRTRAALDYETKTSYSVTVTVSDGNGGTDSITITINVKDVTEITNTAPVFTDGTSTTRTIAENTASGL